MPAPRSAGCSEQNPLARIIVTGCYAQRAPQEISALPGVSCVIGNSHKHQLAEIVLDEVMTREAGSVRSARHAHSTPRHQTPGPTIKERFSSPTSLLTPNCSRRPSSTSSRDAAGSHENDRTRPNLKVQDGCDNRCSFCVIPSVRGQSRSLPLPQIVREVNALVAAGYREVVISGINLGRWGRDLESCQGKSRRFEDLIRTILAETQLEKLRISSVEPMDWSTN
jgi:threonylcarbamoyladenosine tRNA methylthiotransferase MtaB